MEDHKKTSKYWLCPQWSNVSYNGSLNILKYLTLDRDTANGSCSIVASTLGALRSQGMWKHVLKTHKGRPKQQDIITDRIRISLLILFLMFILKYSECLFCSACFGQLSLLLFHCGPGEVCKSFLVLWRLNLPSLLGVGRLALASMSAELEP